LRYSKLNKVSIQEFNSLVLNNSEGLKPFAISLTGDQEAAKDLCQETMFRAFAYREHYKPDTHIKAWLSTIMRNIFINDYRRNNRRQQVMEAIRSNQDQYSFYDFGLRLKEINTAIHHLPNIFKTACLLYLEGYKYHEIAFVLNEPLGTIKSRIHFAKKMLQKHIDR
jgi:RNA polymerase sigma factor (sigma-70 family)